LVAGFNANIEAFIKSNPTMVKYDTSEDGFTYIVLDNASVRDKNLKKIADLVNNTVNDVDFKIGEIPCEIVYATPSILKFKGVTTAVNTALSEVAADSPIAVVKAKSLVDVTIPETLVKDITDFMFDFISNQSARSEMSLKKTGMTFYQYDKKGHVTFDVEKIAKNSEMSDVNTKIVLPIIRLFERNKTLITTDLSKALEKKGVYLERVNSQSIVLAYLMRIYDEEKGNKEFDFTPIPNEIRRITVNFGTCQEVDATRFGTLIENTGKETLYADIDGASRNFGGNYGARMTKIETRVVIDDIRIGAPVVEEGSEVSEEETLKNIITDILFDNEKFVAEITNAEKYLSNFSMHKGNPLSKEIFDSHTDDAGFYICSSDFVFTDEDKFSLLSSKTFTDIANDTDTFKDTVNIVRNCIKTGKALNLVFPYPKSGVTLPWFTSSNIDYVKYEEPTPAIENN
jgi:hypothetical protein